MINPTKFGSAHLDTRSSRYEFLKFVTKSMKINQEKHFKYQLTTRTHGSTGPTRQRHIEQGRSLTGDKLIDGEVIGSKVTSVVFPTLLHTY